MCTRNANNVCVTRAIFPNFCILSSMYCVSVSVVFTACVNVGKRSFKNHNRINLYSVVYITDANEIPSRRIFYFISGVTASAGGTIVSQMQYNIYYVRTCYNINARLRLEIRFV